MFMKAYVQSRPQLKYRAYSRLPVLKIENFKFDEIIILMLGPKVLEGLPIYKIKGRFKPMLYWSV